MENAQKYVPTVEEWNANRNAMSKIKLAVFGDYDVDHAIRVPGIIEKVEGIAKTQDKHENYLKLLALISVGPFLQSLGVHTEVISTLAWKMVSKLVGG